MARLLSKLALTAAVCAGVVATGAPAARANPLGSPAFSSPAFSAPPFSSPPFSSGANPVGWADRAECRLEERRYAAGEDVSAPHAIGGGPSLDTANGAHADMSEDSDWFFGNE